MRLLPSPRKLAASLAAAAVVLIGHPSPALAATGTVDTHHTVDGATVEIGGKRLSTSLIPIRFTDGESVLTYCIDFTTPAKHQARMIEDDWKNYPNPSTSFRADPAKVNWILHHSYPDLPLSRLRASSGIERLTKQQAIAGTQLAIWHFSNDTRPDESNERTVLDLYGYLTGPKNVGLAAEPAPTLRFVPAKATGVAGERLGPLTVRTTAKTVQLRFRTDSKATLVDPAGAPVTEARDGAQLYVKVPAGAQAGRATVNAEVSTSIDTGRLFRGDRVKTQTLIAATRSKVTVDERATATWTAGSKPVPSPPTTPPTPSATATPSPSQPPVTTAPPTTAPPAPGTGGDQGGSGLPVTGFQTGLIAAVGVLLLGGGAALFFLTRRRKHA